MTTYDVTVEIDQDIPDDVLAEHIGHALKSYRVESKPKINPRVTVRRVRERLQEPVTYRDGGVIVTGNPESLIAGKYTGTDFAFTKEQIRALGGASLTYIDEVAKRLKGQRNHPFEGPEVFDDEPLPTQDEWTAETITNTPQALSGEMYPKTGELLRDLNARKPEDEGDWDLEKGDNVGSD